MPFKKGRNWQSFPVYIILTLGLRHFKVPLKNDGAKNFLDAILSTLEYIKNNNKIAVEQINFVVEFAPNHRCSLYPGTFYSSYSSLLAALVFIRFFGGY